MAWRNPYPRRIVTSPIHPEHGEAAVFRAGRFWRGVSPVPPQPALRLRAGAREACRRLLAQRDTYLAVMKLSIKECDAAIAQRNKARAELLETQLQLEGAIDSSAEGGWMARAASEEET